MGVGTVTLVAIGIGGMRAAEFSNRLKMAPMPSITIVLMRGVNGFGEETFLSILLKLLVFLVQRLDALFNLIVGT